MGKIGVFFLLFCGLFAGAEWHPFRDEKVLSKIAKGALIATPRFSKQIVFSKVNLQELTKSRFRLQMDGAESIASGESPELPVLVKQYSVSPGKKYRVRFDNLEFEELDRKIKLFKQPKDEFWGGNPDGKMPLDSTSHVYPGHVVQSNQKDGVLTIKFFPIQYDRKSEAIVLVKSGELFIEELPTKPIATVSTDKNSLIVTSEHGLSAAKILQDFHLTEFKVDSDIVTVESIAKQETPVSEESLPDGYKANASEMGVSGYQYDLARKIKSYLEKRFKTLKSVTLLGTAEMIPPSYYFSVNATKGKKHGVTDLCYAASEQCFRPEIAIGRLPFSTEKQLLRYLRKVEHWMKKASEQPSELALFGGKPFFNPMFLGELGALRAIGEGRGDWRGVQKYFRTLQNYSREKILDVIGDGGSSFVYMLDHGDGNLMHVEKNKITTTDIDLQSKEPSGAAAFWASIACTNGAFDEALQLESVYSDAKFGKRSVGVAMLDAMNGAVGYLGASRPALGVPLVVVDKNGNLEITGSTYGLKILDTFYQKYALGRKGSVGEFLQQSLTDFVADSGTDMESERNRWSYFNTVYLGDPALPLPNRVEKAELFRPAKSSTTFAGKLEEFFPTLKLPSDRMLELVFDHEVSVRGTIFRLDDTGQEIKEIDQTIAGKKSWAVKLDPTPSTYFVRLENQKGQPVERQLWFETTK